MLVGVPSCHELRSPRQKQGPWLPLDLFVLFIGIERIETLFLGNHDEVLGPELLQDRAEKAYDLVMFQR